MLWMTVIKSVVLDRSSAFRQWGYGARARGPEGTRAVATYVGNGMAAGAECTEVDLPQGARSSGPDGERVKKERRGEEE